MTSVASTLLSINKLSLVQSGKKILHQLSADIHRGEMIAILGPNGAGKTSLLRCISRQCGDFQGSILLNHTPVQQYSRQALARKIAMVSQLNDPVFQLSTRDVVRMGLLPHKGLFTLDNADDRNTVDEALAKTDLLSLANKAFHVLSGGEQQRALIARALVQRAPLLLLDEPTNHLDVYYQHQILTLIASLGLTVLLTIHDINLAAEYCQRLLLLNHGQIVADGPPSQVLRPELLTEVFHLPCQQTSDANGTRVFFQRPEPAL